MAKVIVYDEYTNRLFTYNLSENDPMPYAYGNTMRVREFRGSSNSPTLWTTTRAMEAWNLTRRRYGKGIYIGYAFKRIWEGGHGTASQHYAGVSFDVGQNVSYSQRVAIRNARRDGNSHVSKSVKEDNLPEDEQRRTEAEIQKLTDKYVAEVDAVFKKKEAEVMEI